MKFAILWIILQFPISLSVLNIAFAQCGESFTSCYICHDAKEEMPVMFKGAWHRDHSFGYLCDFCHGGNIISQIKEEAHINMIVNPLKDPVKTCAPCHVDYKDRVKKYAPASVESDRIDENRPAEPKPEQDIDSGSLEK
jgi:hypothetical protein